MGIVVRQGLKGIIATYLGVVIGAFNILWLFPKFLTPEEIGLTRVIIDVALLMAALSQFGTPNIADRFFAFFKDDQKKHQGFFLLLIVYPLLGFIIIGFIFLLLKDFWIKSYEARSPLLLDYFYHIIPMVFFIVYMNVLEAYARIHFRIVVPTLVREVFLRVFLAVIVILYHLKIISLNELIIYIVVSYFLAVVILLAYIKNLKKLYLDAGNVFKNKPMLKEMFLFGLFIFLGGAWGLIAAKIDVIMLSSMKDLGSTGVYSIAFFIGTVIEIPRRAISQISTPLISQAWKNNDLQSIQDLYTKTALNQLIAGVLLFILIWCNVDFLLSIIPNSEEFKAGKYVILLIGIGRLTDMATGVNSEIILNSSYYRFNFFLICCSAIVLIGASYIFIPIYGINGAALSTLICIALFNAIKSIFVFVKFKMHPFTKNYFLTLAFGVVAFVLAMIIPEVHTGIFSPFANIALRSLVILISFLGLVIYFKSSSDLDALMKEVFKRIKTRNWKA